MIFLCSGSHKKKAPGWSGLRHSSMPVCAAESSDDFRLSCVCLTAKAWHPHVMMPMTLGLSPVTNS